MNTKRIAGIGIVVVVGLLAGWIVMAFSAPGGSPENQPAISVTHAGDAGDTKDGVRPTGGPSAAATKGATPTAGHSPTAGPAPLPTGDPATQTSVAPTQPAQPTRAVQPRPEPAPTSDDDDDEIDDEVDDD